MAIQIICDNCKKPIIEKLINKTILLGGTQTKISYNYNHKHSSQNGLYFNYSFDLCLDCFKKFVSEL